MKLSQSYLHHNQMGVGKFFLFCFLPLFLHFVENSNPSLSVNFNRYIDDGQLVVNLKKQDPDLKWPDIVESWESLIVGAAQLLKGTSIYIVGNSTEINQKVARELAVGLGYTSFFSLFFVSFFLFFFFSPFLSNLTSYELFYVHPRALHFSLLLPPVLPPFT